MTPSAIAARETLQLVREAAPFGASVLDVGCGRGELAVALMREGFDVLAVDDAPEAVAAARARGVDARRAAWPELACAPRDVVLFSRSLHHIEPLAAAVDRAAERLAAGGCVVVEDFAFTEATPLARQWIDRMARLLDAARILEPRPDTLLAHLLAASTVDEGWERARDPHLHPATSIDAALRRRFAEVRAWTAPYLFRYLADALPDDARGAGALEAVLALERDVGAAVPSFLIGRRWSARAPRPAAGGGA